MAKEDVAEESRFCTSGLQVYFAFDVTVPLIQLLVSKLKTGHGNMIRMGDGLESKESNERHATSSRPG